MKQHEVSLRLKNSSLGTSVDEDDVDVDLLSLLLLEELSVDPPNIDPQSGVA